MHLAFITIGFSPLRMSGLDISGERLVKGLLAQGHQVTVFAGQRAPLPETIQHPALQIIRIPLKPTNWLEFGLNVARQLTQVNRQTPFDLIHFWDIYFAWAYRGNFVASLQHSFQQRLATSQNVGPIKKIYYLFSLYFAEYPAIRRARGLLAGSATSMQSYLDHYHIPLQKIALARHGIDTDFFRPIPDTASLRAQLGIAPTEPVLIYSGFFTARKGLEYLAQALPLITPPPRLILTGRWTTNSHQKFYALLGPACSQVLEAGFVPDALMPTYFSLADLYISSSLLEGFGLPSAEALACETPIVAADAGSVREVTGPGGLLVPPADPRALATAITALLANPDQRRQLGAAGRAHILKNFSIQSMIAAHLNAYQKFKP